MRLIEALIFAILVYIAYLIERLNNNIYLMMDGVRLIPGAINDLKKKEQEDGLKHYDDGSAEP